jgi:glycosyltransferase involved in cell wall biosynthesis
VRVVHNGVRRDELEPIPLAQDASDIVFLGELRRLKGVDVLIDAIAQLNREGRAVTAKLVGDGPDRTEFEAKARELGLSHAVAFCGPLPTRDALALGRLVVLPSRAESLPYVVLEAAAAAKPLVATKVGGIPEIFGPSADRLVMPGDMSALAAAIRAVLDQPDKAAADANLLRDRIATKFSVDAMTDAILGAYQQARSVAAIPAASALQTRDRLS